MKRKILKYIFLLYVSILSVLFLFIFLPGFALEEKQSIIAIENATVDAYTPNVNYGGSTELEVGYLTYQSNFGGSQPTEFSEWTTYIKFDFSKAPVNFHRAELKLDWIYVEASTFVNIYETSNEWSEFTITQNNAPSNGEWVSYNYITYETVYIIDVLNAIEDDTENWSIYLSTDDSNWLSLASINCFSWNNPPEVEFYYFKASNIPVIIVSIVTIVLMIIIIGGITYNKYRKKGQ